MLSLLANHGSYGILEGSRRGRCLEPLDMAQGRTPLGDLVSVGMRCLPRWLGRVGRCGMLRLGGGFGIADNLLQLGEMAGDAPVRFGGGQRSRDGDLVGAIATGNRRRSRFI